MEDNGRKVTDTSEAPFFMSQLLSKLDPKDNTDYGRDMYREKKEENVHNLVEWLQREASVRMRGKPDHETDIKTDRQSQNTRPLMVRKGTEASAASTNTARKLGLQGMCSRLMMNLAGGKKKTEESELVEVNIVPSTDLNVKKTFSAFTIQRTCSPAKTVSRKSVENFSHLKDISKEVYLSGGTIDDLVGTSFSDAFVDAHVITGKSGEPIAKKNIFGWYIVGQFATESSNCPQINYVDVDATDTLQDMKNLFTQDMLGVKPTEMCICTDNVLEENKFVKSLEQSTKIVDERVQVKMPWKDAGPPKSSNYDLALKRMYSAERDFKRKYFIPSIY
ncbi:hypothetical protein AC249_AIPGENE7689 [Exaiptasia diaphana]|nr:hypothetical protein AC249_AIPGENE7689 [Exaiptasia diaphana]